MSARTQPFDDEVDVKTASVVTVATAKKESADSLARGAADVLTAVATVVVQSQESLDKANDVLQSVLNARKRVEDFFRPDIDRAHKLHKSLLASLQKFAGPLDEAERIVKRKIGVYLREQDRLRLEAERLRVLAEKKAERIAEKGIDEAHKKLADGDDEAADAVVIDAHAKAEAALATAPVVPDKPVAENISLRKLWRFEIVDAALVPREYCKPDEVLLQKIVSHTKEQTRIAGIRVYAETSVAAKVRA